MVHEIIVAGFVSESGILEKCENLKTSFVSFPDPKKWKVKIKS